MRLPDLELSPFVKSSEVVGFTLSKRTGKYTRWMEFSEDELRDLYTLLSNWKEGRDD